MLKINNLEVSTDGKTILKDFNLIINDGEIHAIMGPNGVGKSTLSRVIMGDSNYKINNGDIIFNGDNLSALSTDERAKKGIFLAMQYPIEIEGVSNQDFLRTAISSVNNKRIGLYDFILKCEKGAEELSMNKDLIHRSLNVGFSGGEKKKNEVLQIKLLSPKFIILDELDSGLDVDSLRIVGENIKKYKEENKETSILIITHHPKILEYLKPDFVHVMNNGKILKTGNYSLANEIEKNGYNEYLNNENIMTKEDSNE
ncbi:MAG: Fe-S cluster assembly ATPase SufC [Bacilli bacterium]